MYVFAATNNTQCFHRPRRSGERRIVHIGVGHIVNTCGVSALRRGSSAALFRILLLQLPFRRGGEDVAGENCSAGAILTSHIAWLLVCQESMRFSTGWIFPRLRFMIAIHACRRAFPETRPLLMFVADSHKYVCVPWHYVEYHQSR